MFYIICSLAPSLLLSLIVCFLGVEAGLGITDAEKRREEKRREGLIGGREEKGARFSMVIYTVMKYS
jgi:hypothetical protein